MKRNKEAKELTGVPTSRRPMPPPYKEGGMPKCDNEYVDVNGHKCAILKKDHKCISDSDADILSDNNVWKYHKLSFLSILIISWIVSVAVGTFVSIMVYKILMFLIN
jgi:outer membrane scaffolding protein for murein synthesis (MipA/OmpV family)